MLVEIYVDVDDFCKAQRSLQARALRHCGAYKKLHASQLTLSEIMTILIHYHLSPYKNFKAYYTTHVCQDLRRDFPDLVSYDRFVALIPRTLIPMMLHLADRCGRSLRTGVYYIDSTPLSACHPRRAHQHRTMKGFASTNDASYGFENKVGTAVAVPGSPGTYRIEGLMVSAGQSGSWLPKAATTTGPLSASTVFRYWARVVTTGAGGGMYNGKATGNYITATMSAPAAAATVARILPRQDGNQTSRFNGAVFEGSNSPDPSGPWQNLATISSGNSNLPSQTATTDYPLASNAYRYLRFRASPTGFGELAEIEFRSASGKLTGSWSAFDDRPAYPTAAAYDGNTSTFWHSVNQGTMNWIMLDTQGNSGARIAAVEGEQSLLTLTLKAYPNPVQDEVKLAVLVPAAGIVIFSVLDVTGRERQTRQQALVEGANEVELRLGALPSGIYLIRSIDTLGRQAVVRVNKQ